MPHEAIRYGDEYQCAKCGKAWDINDPEPPPCKTGKDLYNEQRKRLSEVLLQPEQDRRARSGSGTARPRLTAAIEANKQI